MHINQRVTCPFAQAVVASVFLLVYCVPPAQADDQAPQWTLDVGVEHTRQTFADTDGRYTSLTLTPAVEWGDGWQLRLELPWRNTQGEVVLPRATPSVVKVCEWVQLHPRRVQAWLAQGRITQAQLDLCNDLDGGVASTEAEGVADLTLWLNRFIPLSEQWAVLPQAGYKTDSGDADQGLGTGTRDLLIEAALYGDFAPVSLYALLGREQVLQQNDIETLDDFTYASLELDYAITTALTVGAGCHLETAQVDYLDDMQSISTQVRWKFLKNYSAQLTLQRYNEESGYPNREVTLGVNASF